MSALETLQEAQEELHAASLCLGAAKGTNYTTDSGRLAVEEALERLGRAAEAYYTILMSIRGKLT